MRRCCITHICLQSSASAAASRPTTTWPNRPGWTANPGSCPRSTSARPKRSWHGSKAPMPGCQTAPSTNGSATLLRYGGSVSSSRWPRSWTRSSGRAGRTQPRRWAPTWRSLRRTGSWTRARSGRSPSGGRPPQGRGSCGHGCRPARPITDGSGTRWTRSSSVSWWRSSGGCRYAQSSCSIWTCPLWCWT